MRLLNGMLLPVAGLALGCGGEEAAGPTSKPEATQHPLAEVVIASTAVDQTGDVGRYTSLAIGPDGRHITYFDATNEDLKYAMCASNCAFAGAWTKGAVDKVGDVGVYSSLKIGPNGRRHVTYLDLTNSSLRYATCPPSSTCRAATDWVKTTIDQDGISAGALALNEDGGRELAYRAAGSGQGNELRYAVCNAGCGQAANWFKVILDQVGLGSGGSISSLAISAGMRHITYYDADDEELRYATCASNCTNAAMWQKSPIDTDIHAVHSSFVQSGPFGLRHVAYYDLFQGDLKYARCGLNCSAARNWKKVTVASTGNVGLHPSMAVEPNGRVHVSYYGATGTALLYATCLSDCITASGWTRSVLDGSISSVGEYPSLVVRNGIVEISYYDRTNRNLIYLRRTP
jgi:hypothetical protein